MPDHVSENFTRIGVDFDNTIVNYNQLFALTAERFGLVDSGTAVSKNQIRCILRSQPDGEAIWQRIQADVYGHGILRAEPAKGVCKFMRRCRAAQSQIFVVSHKTEFAADRTCRVNLHDQATRWLTENGFFAPGGVGLSPENVFFEPSRVAKVSRIRHLNCDVFIDDLAEVFMEDNFPEQTRRLLYAPDIGHEPSGPFDICRSWMKIEEIVLAAVH